MFWPCLTDPFLYRPNINPLGAAAREHYDEDIADASDRDVELRDADELNGDESGSGNDDSSEM